MQGRALFNVPTYVQSVTTVRRRGRGQGEQEGGCTKGGRGKKQRELQRIDRALD